MESLLPPRRWLISKKTARPVVFYLSDVTANFQIYHFHSLKSSFYPFLVTFHIVERLCNKYISVFLSFLHQLLFFVSRDVNKLKKIKCSLLLRKRKKCETLPRRADTGDSFQETPPHSIST